MRAGNLQARTAVAAPTERVSTTAALRPTLMAAGFGAMLNAGLSLRMGAPPEFRGEQVLVQAGIFVAFALLLFPVSRMVREAGPCLGRSLGQALLGAGSLLLLPSVGLASPILLPAGALVMTVGAALLHISSNLGDVFPSQVTSLNLAQGFFAASAAAGPWICGFPPLQGNGVPGSNGPYVAAAIVFGTAALLSARLRFPAVAPIDDSHSRGPKLDGPAIFCAIGAELALACFLVSFCVQLEFGGLSVYGAAGYVPLYWAGIVSGRLAGKALLGTLRPGRLAGIVAVAACLLITASIAGSGNVAVWSLILAGAAASTLVPAIFELAGSALLLPALAGGAIVPLAEAALADRIGLHAALVIPAVCCLYIMFYGFARPESWAGRLRRRERRQGVCSIDSQNHRHGRGHNGIDSGL
jgi:FHS family L-fucose permease-like MFS transporter